MRKPVVVFVRGDLLLAGPIRAHAPNLHRAAALRIEVDELAIGRIIRAVIESLRGGQPRLFAAIRGNGVNVEVAVAFRAVSQRFAVGRPAVPIRGTEASDAFGRAAGDGERVD